MDSFVNDDFWKYLSRLPENIQEAAKEAYKKWQHDPFYPSLFFKCISKKNAIYSIRVGKNYRALGKKKGNSVYWFWIGSHEDYNKIISHF